MIQNNLSSKTAFRADFITFDPKYMRSLQHSNEINRPGMLPKNKKCVPRNVKIDEEPKKVIRDYFINLANW